jgi:FkbM family methyltransferase
MLIPIEVLSKKFSIVPTGILHVGAHLGEERSEYIANQWGRIGGVVWIEAQSDLCDQLKRNFDDSFPFETVINALAWNEDGRKKDFFIANNTQSSSLLKFGTHSELYPSIKTVKAIDLETSRLDSLLAEHSSLQQFDFVNLDVQGAELETLVGMGELLKQVRWIYSEVNFDEVYENCAKVKEIDEFLLKIGFKRLLTKKSARGGWGDALYVREASLLLILRSIYWSALQTIAEKFRLFSGILEKVKKLILDRRD